MTMEIKMTQFYCGFRNGNVDWQPGETHEIDEEAGQDLIERGYAVEVKPEMKTAAAVEQLTPAGKAATQTAQIMKANRGKK